VSNIIFPKAFFFLIALLFMKVGEGRFLCGFYKALVTFMQECLYHHDECCFVSVQTSPFYL